MVTRRPRSRARAPAAVHSRHLIPRRDIRTLDRVLPLADEASRSRPEVYFRLMVEVVHRNLDDRALVTRRMDEAAERAILPPRRWQLAPNPFDLDALLDRRDAALVE